jgi:hypothetical protein
VRVLPIEYQDDQDDVQGFGYDTPLSQARHDNNGDITMYDRYAGGFSDDDDHPFNDSHCDSGDSYDEDSDTFGGNVSLRALGLLNGQYTVSSAHVSSEWDFLNTGFELVLTLDGSVMWGKLDLGIIQGVIWFASRPMNSSHDAVPFSWRGQEHEGVIWYNDRQQRGWMRFLGGGRIEGQIDFMDISFKGLRTSGQGTRSVINASSMQREWNEYTEDEYERLNQARWR